MAKLDLKSYETIINLVPNMIWRAGVDAKYDFFNKRWLEFTGKKLEEELGDQWTSSIHPDDLNRYLEIYQDAFHKRLPFEIEYQLRRHDAKWRKINHRGVPYYSETNEFLGYIGSCLDITDKAESKIPKDELARISSQQHLEKLLLHELEKSTDGLSIIIIDIDNFKKINDTFGPVKGDQVLKYVAEIIKDKLAKGNFLGRYDGDDYIVALATSNVNETFEMAEKIRKAISKNSIIPQESNLKLTVSIGLSTLTSEQRLSDLIKKADQAKITAKKSGGNMTLANPTMKKLLSE